MRRKRKAGQRKGREKRQTCGFFELNRRIHGPFFPFPATLILRFAGPEETKNLAGKCPPPDSDPFNRVKSLEDRAGCSRQIPDALTADEKTHRLALWNR